MVQSGDSGTVQRECFDGQTLDVEPMYRPPTPP